MNKLNTQSTTLTLSPSSRSELASFPMGEPACWLIVLVPCVEADLTTATRRIWELANAGGKRVRFIGLYENAAQELSLRRQMVGMSAMVGSTGIYTETEAVFGKNWSEVMRSRWQEGDLVVCFAEQRVGLSRRPLSQILQSDLDVPLFILSDLYQDVRSNWSTRIAAWAGSIAIIVGFFVLQVKLDHLTTDWTHIVLPLLSIPAEVGLIWAWNSMFE